MGGVAWTGVGGVQGRGEEAWTNVGEGAWREGGGEEARTCVCVYAVGE